MTSKKGNLSIHSENIFPIIKKWLYSDHDIFIRELVSNASDAITKVKRLASLGEADLKDNKDFKITVEYDEKAETIKVSDNGIGMTAEEIEKYINQIAFSGAEEFVEKFKDKADQDQIIGHFGLGFYSAFMVAKTVTIDTLSYLDGAEPAFWTCDGGTEFSIEKGQRTERGTTITLYLGDDGADFKNEYKIRNTLNKYCGFMPYPIYMAVVGKEEPAETTVEEPKENDGIVEVEETAEGEQPVAKEPEEPKMINTPNPLYNEQPSNVKDEQYLAFYRETFHDFKDPLFWIHLNMEYPFKLKGILYFPKINSEFEGIEGQIKLYNSQVYVADNIKEVIPEFLLLLKGVIDCPDLPLNVSRSFLQNDGFVKKIQDYITKKVADKLNGLFKADRVKFEGFWKDINPFVKFGALRDDKFYEKIKDSVLYNTTADKFMTMPEYQAEMTEVLDKTVYYVSDSVQQAQYIAMLQEIGAEAIIMPEHIDQAFIGLIESKMEGVTFKRVDDDVSDLLAEKESDEDKEKTEKLNESLAEIFKSALSLNELKVSLKALKAKEIASMMTLSESSRRMQDMMKMYAMGGAGMDLPSDETLVLNKNHKLVKYTLEHLNDDDETKDLIIKQLYDLAVLSHKPLTQKQMQDFIQRSNEIMLKMI